MNNLMRDKNVVIIGGSGIIGRGIVLVSRSAETAQTLQKSFTTEQQKRVCTVVGDFGNESGANCALKLLKEVLDGGSIHHVVVSVGNLKFANAPSESNWSELTSALDEAPRSLYHAAKAFLPEMKDVKGSSFTSVSGLIAYGCPAPSMWAAAVKYAAINILTTAFHSEFKETQVRNNSVVVGAAIADEPGMKNKLGMTASVGAKQLGVVFTKIALEDMDGQLIDINNASDIDKFLKG
jgi:short-subunit dehydrogenase